MEKFFPFMYNTWQAIELVDLELPRIKHGKYHTIASCIAFLPEGLKEVVAVYLIRSYKLSTVT